MFHWLTLLRTQLDWVFNTFLGNRHTATMILKSYGLKSSSFTTRREYSVWRDGYRLCQIQEAITPGKIRLLMRIRLYVAHERPTKENPQPLYRVYWTFHLLNKKKTPTAYAFISEPFMLKQLSMVLKSSRFPAATAQSMHGLIQNSKNFVPPTKSSVVSSF